LPNVQRRRLFLIENVVLVVCMVVGIVLIFVVSSGATQLVVFACLAVIAVINLILRLTYFRNVIPELRAERERRRSGEQSSGT
jgi:uncharacterized membrane protein